MFSPAPHDRERIGVPETQPLAGSLPDPYPDWNRIKIATPRDLDAFIDYVQPQIEAVAREKGLDFFPQRFVQVDTHELNVVAAFEGFPKRYPHWRFGQAFDELAKKDSWGLARIAELVINNDPCYAYLRKDNSLVEQLFVMNHVYAHNDFFKNNFFFRHTERSMVDRMAQHAVTIQRYVDRHGFAEVEQWIDVCLSLETLIDPHGPSIKRGPVSAPDEQVDPRSIRAPKLQAKPYMDRFINPPEALAEEEKRLRSELEAQRRFPLSPQRDVLGFLARHAKMEIWQQEVLEIVREEAYYFNPQGQTKVMNEGWASYWHSHLMTQVFLRRMESGLVEYADENSKVLFQQPKQLNPYRLGVMLFRDIEDRWNKGRFGDEYERCDELGARERWDRKLGLGRDKIFEVRRIYNDVMFIDEFFTQEFCERQKFFTYKADPQGGPPRRTGTDFRKIKEMLLDSFTNRGRPELQVTDADFRHRGELCLQHTFRGHELDRAYAEATMKNLFAVWRRPVHVLTESDDEKVRLSYDGSKFESGEI